MSKRATGFTIVELLIVVVVIAILAAITIVAYNGISNRSKETALKSDLSSGAKQLQIIKTTNDSYPIDTNTIKKSDSTTFQYVNSGQTFCLSATSSQLAGRTFYITSDGSIQEGSCPTLYIQTVTSAACATSRTMVADARDNRSYWIQKLADGKCWMLTNLAYSGGGTNTYGDVKTLIDGTAQASTYTAARYYTLAASNPTTYPTQPSTSTDGGATNPQYGYLYNWCAAMGVQASTGACLNNNTPAPNSSLSVCPAGWRLPTGGVGGEIAALNAAVNSGSLITDSGLRTIWMAQKAGYWWDGYVVTGVEGYYWSGSQASSTLHSAHNLLFNSGFVYPATSTYDRKPIGMSLRCVAV